MTRNLTAGHVHEGWIPAMEVIEVDDNYRRLAEHLLGNVFIAENEEALDKQQWLGRAGENRQICKREILPDRRQRRSL